MCLRQGIAASLILGAAAHAVAAEDILCAGEGSGWILETSGDEATFRFRGKKTLFQIRLSTDAEGEYSAVAHTLISDFDTAILLVDSRSCGSDAPMTGYVMTQSRGLPILLPGCCRPAGQ
ncbi:MAG: hypothetical protein GY947_08590 [Rhodobacteraceae bacterium]|nr:hypothetical protein [Paracoccaceae bacterium]